jgi:hypothetical protein
MSMEKAIASGKEHRKEYRGSKAIDCSCRNHGTCTYCLMNRLYKNLKKEEKMLDMEREFCYNNYRTKERED